MNSTVRVLVFFLDAIPGGALEMYRYRPTAVLLNAVLVLPPVRSRCDWRWIAV
jgi:hypothetical protein